MVNVLDIPGLMFATDAKVALAKTKMVTTLSVLHILLGLSVAVAEIYSTHILNISQDFTRECR